jgi:Fe2+ transport system protein FeoA
VQPLSTLPAGAAGVVQALELPHDDRCRDRLLAMGVTPGTRLTVLQTFPAVVFLCDETELVVEHPVADAILVRVPAAARARNLSRAR